jgi:hypothetical protein
VLERVSRCEAAIIKYSLLAVLNRRREQNLNYKTMSMGFGAILIIIALILGGVQILHIYNIFGGSENRWYFYGGVGVIGLVGIALVAWALMKKTPKK